MTLRHLEVFRAVCARESITLAAEHLNMTQPAVSLAVKELEAFYGVQLLERMNRRIYITDAGNYVTPGWLYCLRPDGTQRWRQRTGDIPAHFAFYATIQK